MRAAAAAGTTIVTYDCRDADEYGEIQVEKGGTAVAFIVLIELDGMGRSPIRKNRIGRPFPCNINMVFTFTST